MSLLRKKIISANWKMNMRASDVAPYLAAFIDRLLLQSADEDEVPAACSRGVLYGNTRAEKQESNSPRAVEFPKISNQINMMEGVEVILIPPFTSLPKASQLLMHVEKIPILLGAQNIASHEKGAFTGEISAAMLRDLWVQYVLIGHSERRQLFGETNTIIHQKMKIAHHNELLPILCVGETLEERSLGKEKKIIEQQLREALTGLSLYQMANTMIAYEPVWAIGTGKTATIEEAEEVHAFIRSIITELSDQSTADSIRLQYGGSVTPLNAQELLSAPNIDGALVGSASLDPCSFAEIVKKAVRA